ncbi:MAG: hemerythrin domain-containing protein [Pseudomonadota bacterium]|nr:hemerythrin domain-containing protein [Pseudomonadota bacterium]
MEHTLEARRPFPRFGSREDAQRSSQAPICDVIEADHTEILRLFEAIAWYAEGEDERLDLFGLLRQKVLAHIRAQRDVTYPSLAAELPVTARSIEDHQAIHTELDNLGRTPAGDRWYGDFAALHAGVRAHMQRDRRSFCSRLKQEIPPAEQIALGRAYESARNEHLRELAAR